MIYTDRHHKAQAAERPGAGVAGVIQPLVRLSYIVNRRNVKRIVDNKFWIDNDRIPPGETYRTAFMQQIEQRLW